MIHSKTHSRFSLALFPFFSCTRPANGRGEFSSNRSIWDIRSSTGSDCWSANRRSTAAPLPRRTYNKEDIGACAQAFLRCGLGGREACGIIAITHPILPPSISKSLAVVRALPVTRPAHGPRYAFASPLDGSRACVSMHRLKFDPISIK